MRLTVDHVTTYRYDHPVRSVVQSHRLTPSVFEGQRALDWAVQVSGGVPGAAFRDGAGDRVQGWTVAGPVTEITVTVKGVVETSDLAGVLRGHRETVAPGCYLRDTRRRRPMRHWPHWRKGFRAPTCWRWRTLCRGPWPMPSLTAPGQPMPIRPRPRRWPWARASARTTPTR